jgi:hypothetical protein
MVFLYFFPRGLVPLVILSAIAAAIVSVAGIGSMVIVVPVFLVVLWKVCQAVM